MPVKQGVGLKNAVAVAVAVGLGLTLTVTLIPNPNPKSEEEASIHRHNTAPTPRFIDTHVGAMLVQSANMKDQIKLL